MRQPLNIQIRVENHLNRDFQVKLRQQGAMLVLEVWPMETRTEGGIILKPDQQPLVPFTRVDGN